MNGQATLHVYKVAVPFFDHVHTMSHEKLNYVLRQRSYNIDHYILHLRNTNYQLIIYSSTVITLNGQNVVSSLSSRWQLEQLF